MGVLAWWRTWMVLLGSWCQRGTEQPQDWWISLIVDEWNGVTAIKYKLALRVGGFWRKTCFLGNQV